MRQSIIVILILCGTVGCGINKPAIVDCGVLGTGYRLENGTVDLLVIPRIGRTMRYGYISGNNVLFEDPAAAGKSPSGAFVSWGGDKAWIWPQSDWPKLIHRGFPPPAAADGEAWEVQVLSKRSLRLTSHPIEPWGVRIQRDVTLADHGTEVIWVNRLVQVRSAISPAAAVWTITQIPKVNEITVRTRGRRSTTLPYESMMQGPWLSVQKEGELLHFFRNPGAMSKSGIDGDQIEVRIGTTTFRQTLTLPTDGQASPERLQLFSFPDPGGDHAAQVPYIELEFTSPQTSTTEGNNLAVLVVHWTLER